MTRIHLGDHRLLDKFEREKVKAAITFLELVLKSRIGAKQLNYLQTVCDGLQSVLQRGTKRVSNRT